MDKTKKTELKATKTPKGAHVAGLYQKLEEEKQKQLDFSGAKKTASPDEMAAFDAGWTSGAMAMRAIFESLGIVTDILPEDQNTSRI